MNAPTGWTVIVPVKLTTIAKSRLADVLTADQRQRIAVAFAVDTVSAAIRCDLVDRVIVVTNDPVGPRFSELGADVVRDVPDAGLNPALEYASAEARSQRPDSCVAAISSDLPALRPTDLATALDAVALLRWFVADAAGIGTTLIAAATGEAFTPRFGAHSRDAHRDAGMVELQVSGIERLRRDVDTADDLAIVRSYGVGRATSALLDELDRLR